MSELGPWWHWALTLPIMIAELALLRWALGRLVRQRLPNPDRCDGCRLTADPPPFDEAWHRLWHGIAHEVTRPRKGKVKHD